MPEIWIPYGNVEALVSVQAENLGAVAEIPPSGSETDFGRISELVKGAEALFLCDSAPATIELLRGVIAAVGENTKVYSPAPRKIENSIQEAKGRVATLPPPVVPVGSDEPTFAPQLLESGPKIFIGTARPDSFFGIVDAKVEACLDWVARSQASAAKAMKAMEPQPFQKTDAYDSIEGLATKIPESRYLTAISRNGRLWTALEDPPFDAIKNGFPRVQMPPSRGLIIGAGGKGYDDTLSSTLRGVWSAMGAVRKLGSVLVVAECSEGAGATALEAQVTGRTSAEGDRRREKREGMEEIFYLSKLKEEYDVLLLSGLPETYARSKLGFTTAKGSAEAVGRLLNKVGRSGKLNVIPRAPECLVEAG